MGLKGLAIFVALLSMVQTPVALSAQPTGQSSAIRPATSWQVSAFESFYKASLRDVADATPGTDSSGGIHDFSPPRVSVANPPSTPSIWSLHERITWAANLVLVVLGYAGIMLAYSLLKKIERQTAYAETAANAAAASAHAALLNAQAVVHSERPWILITVEPSRSSENSFTVMATNRGRTPARITATAEQAMIAVDERYLPIPPEYDREEPKAPVVPIILVPGESTTIKTFSRDEVKALCDSEERFRRIETWEEKVYLYGNVVYTDLMTPPGDPVHETNWCCWYIHGRQNSGLVIAGPPEYNSHA
ncbi:MAG: hypothetical protein WBQ94_07185 [Terracidiphilus sp.]